MHNNYLTQAVIAVSLVMSSVLVPAAGRATGDARPAQDSGPQQTLTGLVSDSICKGQAPYKGATRMSCTLQCVARGADYVLIVDDSVYVLDGDRSELAKFAGGRATVAGHVSGNRISVNSVVAAKKNKRG